MNIKLEELLGLAKTAPFTPDDKEAQRRSFVYGNTKIENDRITHGLVDQEAERLAANERE
jgi:hypothetical protein